ncbi:molybdopterin cofactor-binding domain-containing protein [Polymorphobacter sp. PAMC 29334]|uniref:molybdopterin cofactor-binding domain-containing protein n=1 Tax=Polymorphobacter sp. PAMC 29334 TaxID=2862331 RepID=UPI00210554C1|nr:molybdopterin cofactor-binding domain-containing protein [Polymorphobacter sp. PAMC 29334]
MGTATTTAKVAADQLGLPLDNVSVGYGDTIIPGAIMAGRSQLIAAIGAAVIAAHHALVAELLKLAGNGSPLAGLSPDKVGSIDSGLAQLADPARRADDDAVLLRPAEDRGVAFKEASLPLELTHWSMHSHSALFCEVRVNTVTGETLFAASPGSSSADASSIPRPPQPVPRWYHRGSRWP